MSRCIRFIAKEVKTSQPQQRWGKGDTRWHNHKSAVLDRQSQICRHQSTSSTNSHGSSVSASEVSHFTKLASSWWDPHGPSRLLHLMNPLRHEFIRTCLASAPAQRVDQAKKHTYWTSVAEVESLLPLQQDSPIRQCNSNRSYTRSNQSGQITSTNRSSPFPTWALELYKLCNRRVGRAQREESHPEYDFVSVFEVIEHIDKPAAFLRQALSHVKPGGWLIGSTIARHPISYLTTKVVAEAPWPIGVVPAGTHDWNKYINPPKEMEAWFTKGKVLSPGISSEQRLDDKYGKVQIEGCIYLPLVGWRWVKGSEQFGNYFFGVQRLH
ncbi:hypothetical protein MRB53_039167 [Persea americana]|nr:hypothetical protein MRB53_039167 [Persea americana]